VYAKKELFEKFSNAFSQHRLVSCFCKASKVTMIPAITLLLVLLVSTLALCTKKKVKQSVSHAPEAPPTASSSNPEKQEEEKISNSKLCNTKAGLLPDDNDLK
jgi:hypothetical protein